VSKYLPEQHELLKGKNENQIASFLLKLDYKTDKMSYYRNQIFAFCRMPNEELQSALAKLTNLLNTVYPANEVVNLPHRESILKVAVLSFLPDELSVPILSEIQNAAYKCKPLSYEHILKMATAAEKHSMIKPTAALQFGRTIGTSPSPAYFQLNSMVTDPTSLSFSRKRNVLTADLNESYPNYHTPVPSNSYQRLVPVVPPPPPPPGGAMAQRVASHSQPSVPQPPPGGAMAQHVASQSQPSVPQPQPQQQVLPLTCCLPSFQPRQILLLQTTYLMLKPADTYLK
jgi:hypothetical protein